MREIIVTPSVIRKQSLEMYSRKWGSKASDPKMKSTLYSTLVVKTRSLCGTCIAMEIFAALWEQLKLVLLLKPGKTSDEPSSYSSIFF